MARCQLASGSGDRSIELGRVDSVDSMTYGIWVIE